MTEKNNIVLVQNRDVGSVGYVLDSGVHRKFEHNETKKIPIDELEELSYAPGGEYILKHCLMIQNKAALDFLNLSVEPEYFYTEEDVKKILIEGDLDQLEDTLNFAPDGVIDMIKKIAVDLKIPDTRKRDLISKKTGFNINSAINVNHILAEENDEDKIEEKPKRKSKPIRKATPPTNKYDVVSIQE